jgi:hypothetical protein
MTVITMSRRELAHLHVLIDLAEGRIAVDEAAALTELGRRQVLLAHGGGRAEPPPPFRRGPGRHPCAAAGLMASVRENAARI